MSSLFRPSLLWLPERLAPSGWIEHVPFGFWLVDVLRPEAAETLARFKAAGVTVRIISGDDPETVAALARQAGLEVGPHTLANGAERRGREGRERDRSPVRAPHVAQGFRQRCRRVFATAGYGTFETW